MRLCPGCGGLTHNIKMVDGKLTFVPCYPCGAFGTIYPAPPIAQHIAIPNGQLRSAGANRLKRSAV